MRGECIIIIIELTALPCVAPSYLCSQGSCCIEKKWSEKVVIQSIYMSWNTVATLGGYYLLLKGGISELMWSSP